METRILPPGESVPEANFPEIPGMSAENKATIAIEQDGKIVACLTVLRATSLEGLWLSPEIRGKAGSMREVRNALIGQAASISQAWGNEWAYAAAADDDGKMRRLLKQVKAVKLAIHTYVLRFGG